MANQQRKYGWHRQKPDDGRDLKFGLSLAQHLPAGFPDDIKLENKMPPIYNQFDTSSCTGNGGARIFQFGQMKAGLAQWTPSRLALYYNARKLEGGIITDGGANIRDMIRGANKFGIAAETEWPFNERKVNDEPSRQYYVDAYQDRIRFYATFPVITIDNLRLCLFHGYPIVFGFDVYDAFEGVAITKPPYTLYMPTPNEGQLGGHCVVISGVEHKNRRFRIENSWGTDWADGGRYWMDYDYIISYLCSDFWMCRFS